VLADKDPLELVSLAGLGDNEEEKIFHNVGDVVVVS